MVMGFHSLFIFIVPRLMDVANISKRAPPAALPPGGRSEAASLGLNTTKILTRHSLCQTGSEKVVKSSDLMPFHLGQKHSQTNPLVSPFLVSLCLP